VRNKTAQRLKSKKKVGMALNRRVSRMCVHLFFATLKNRKGGLHKRKQRHLRKPFNNHPVGILTNRQISFIFHPPVKGRVLHRALPFHVLAIRLSCFSSIANIIGIAYRSQLFPTKASLSSKNRSEAVVPSRFLT
jgi:hypothetical protein